MDNKYFRFIINPILCAIFLAMPLVLAAQTDDPIWRHPLSAETRPRFDRVCKTMTQHKIIKGEFVQTNSLNRLGRSLVSRGYFTVDAGLGVILDTRSPFPSITAVGRGYILQSSGGRTTRMDASGNEIFIRISQAMSAVFSGDSKALIDVFEVHFSETGETWTLGLLPRDSTTKTFVKAIIMRGDSVLREFTFHEQNNGTIRYELSGHSYPVELSSNEKTLFAH
ncbi:MAG: outer membrane lipoprotein carrier protein LolA [Treponema sp.]|jgi:hypothetical protein|nr:outer membrane lipoprotein carrier protein LolA [Treponema sp.]